MRLYLILFLISCFGTSLLSQEKPVTCEYVKKTGKKRGYDIYCTNHTKHNFVVDIDPYYLLNMRIEGSTSRTLVPGKSKVLSLRANDENGRYNFSYRYTYIKGCKNSKHDKNAFYLLPVEEENYTDVIELDNLNEKYGSTAAKDWYSLSFSLSEGDTIYSARAGVIVEAVDNNNIQGKDFTFVKDENYITIQHKDCSFGSYQVLLQNSAMVAEGDHVIPGQPLAIAGGQHYQNGEHVRFSVYRYETYKQKKDGESKNYNYKYIPMDFFVDEERTKLVNRHSYRSNHPHEIITKEMSRRQKKKYKKKHGL